MVNYQEIFLEDREPSGKGLGETPTQGHCCRPCSDAAGHKLGCRSSLD